MQSVHPSREAFALEPLVLVVDDSEDNRDMCAQCLALAGFRVVQAASALEALELAVYADVVLMDLSLPDIDGMEAARRIRKEPRSARVPLVALTGLAMDDVMVRALEAGFDRVLGKPCMPDELARAVRTALDVRAHA